MNADRTAYAIRVDGHLDDHWAAWFGELAQSGEQAGQGEPELTRHDDGTTTVIVTLADQAQLHGILARLRDIGAVISELRAIRAPARRP